MKSIMDKDNILAEITNHYLDSRDFNGIAITNLGVDFEKIKTVLAQLLNEEKVVLNFGDRHPNPHILAFKPESKEEQLKKLEALKFEEPIFEEYGPLKMQTNSISCCVYPSRQHLKTVIETDKYQNKPFTLLLALGEPQLAYRAFNLRILELYRNDPRYSYGTDDIHGSISTKTENELPDSDDTFLETFGFASASNFSFFETISQIFLYTSPSKSFCFIFNSNSDFDRGLTMYSLPSSKTIFNFST